MDNTDGVARLRLARSKNVGPVTYAQLLARFGSAEAALSAIPELARRGGGRAPGLAETKSVMIEMEQVAALGGRYLFLGQSPFPELLAQIPSAPPALIVMGRTELLAQPILAMVGARNASAAARKIARDLACDLGSQGYCIASGLARGIDTASHNGALKTGTIAVVAGGIDIYYPPENESLQREIAERGLVVAEQPPGSEPKARHFPSRNRIIAGLGSGTIVVEAAPKSGSLITARLANEFGRDVMAIPGSPLDPRARGCNQLIRDGATLIQNADDAGATLQPFGVPALRQPIGKFAAESVSADVSADARAEIICLLGPVPISVDELIRQSEIGLPVVQTILLELELAGKLHRHAGGKVSVHNSG